MYGKRVHSVIFSPDGSSIGLVQESGLSLVDADTGELRTTLHKLRRRSEGTTDIIRAVTYKKGLRIATGGRVHSVKLWDLTADKALGQPDIKRNVSYVAFFASGEKLATVTTTRSVAIWNVEDGESLGTFEGHDDMSSFVVSPDGELLAAGTPDGLVRLREVPSGELIHTLKGHTAHVWHGRFSPDGKVLATTAWTPDHTIRLWDVTEGTLLHTLEGHTDPVVSLTFSKDGLRLATASLDRTARLWDVQSGTAVRTLDEHRRVVWGLWLSDEGLRMATASGSIAGINVGLWETPAAETILKRAGTLTNLRVCRKTFDVVPVQPFPEPESVWAPESACAPAAP